MRKPTILLLTIIITPIIAGVYGILHDQFTYTISHEYFTKFKFYQFGLVDMGNEAILPNPRVAVAAVGFMATWWTGLMIGPMLGFTGLIQKDGKIMLHGVCRAMLVVLITTAATGLIGLCYGWIYLSKVGVNWYLPVNLIDKANFITVGSMHNFSYLGGMIGLVFGIIYQFWYKRKMKLETK
jgi:hypothetical protein